MIDHASYIFLSYEIVDRMAKKCSNKLVPSKEELKMMSDVLLMKIDIVRHQAAIFAN
jgi:hypothetical protein